MQVSRIDMTVLNDVANIARDVSTFSTFLQSIAHSLGRSNFFGTTGRRYQRKLTDHELDLSTQYTRLRNCLLSSINTENVLSEEDLQHEDFLNYRGLDIFASDDLGQSFQSTLGPLLPAVRATIQRCERQLSSLKSALYFDHAGESTQVRVRLQGCDTSPSAFVGTSIITELSQQATVLYHDHRSPKEGARRLKAVYDDRQHQTLLALLRELNDDIESAQKLIANQELSRRFREQTKGPLRKLRRLRHNAKEFVSSLAHPKRWWKCNCPQEHIFLVAFEDLLNNERTDLEILHVTCLQQEFLREGSRAGSYHASTIEVKRVSDSGRCKSPYAQQLLVASDVQGGEHPSSSAPVTIEPRKRARFEDFSTQQGYSEEPLPGNSGTYLEDLCAFFNTYNLNQCSLPARLGALNDFAMMSGACHEIDQARVQLEVAQLVQLRTLSDLNCRCQLTTATHTTSNLEISNTERLAMAVTLVTSTFGLQGHSLDRLWTAKDILFRTDRDGGSIVTGEVHVMVPVRQVKQCDAHHTRLSEPEHALEPLGFALAELLLDRRVLPDEAQIQHMNAGQCLSKTQAIQKLFKTFGRQSNSIGKAIQQCFYWSGPFSTQGFDDSTFSAAVFDAIIWPIVQNHMWWEGKGDHSLFGGSHAYSNTTIDGNANAMFGNHYGDIHYHGLHGRKG